MATDPLFLGVGWSFPPRFIKDGHNKVEAVSGVEDINESLEILFSTALGERVLQHQYGCDLFVLLYEPLNATLVATVRDIIERAVVLYEPRIRAETITITPVQLEGRLDIEIRYHIPSSNSRFNFVYPYYLNEANAIQ